MTVLLDAKQIGGAIEDMAARIARDHPGRFELVVVGIRSRGEVLGLRLARLLSDRTGEPIPCGTLDITLYRDDINSPHGRSQPEVRTTDITFNVDDKVIILADDVLFTGRSTRAALDALIDLGRPKAIRLAVLVDRKGREYPIQADYVAFKADAGPEQHIFVRFTESDGKDEVIVE